MPRTLKTRVASSIKRHYLSGAHILVAVSGGGDSVALLYLLTEVARTMKLQITVAHLNHGLRKEADKDEKFVHDLAKELDLPFVGARIIAPSKGFEANARESRYAFLREELAKIKAKKKIIAAAHTEDDQAETLLINLLRGTGVRGLAGMAELENGIWRPLISTSRQELRNYLRSRKRKWLEDASNKDKKFLRNRIRLELIPDLMSYNPNILAALSRTAISMREAEELIDRQAESDLNNLRLGKSALSRKKFVTLPLFRQKEVLRKMIEEQKGDAANIEQVHFEKAVEVINNPHSPRTIEFPGSLNILKSSDKLSFSHFRIKR